MTNGTTTYLVTRDGQIKLRLTGATVDGDGAVTANGAYVVDGDLAKAHGCYDAVVAAARARQWRSINRRYFAKVGTSPSGLTVETEAEYNARMRPPVDAAPEWAERRAISALFAKAARLEYVDSNAYYHTLHEAEAALAAWQAKYPRAAAVERSESLRVAAEHERHLALGALTYDCDGSLSREDQDREHDRRMAVAADLDRQADALSPA